MSPMTAYKRSPALTNSTWYKGMLVSEMAGTADNKGAFDLSIFKIKPGTEPPPHVHSREDEFVYILSGEMKFYVDGEVFTVADGECMFLPRLKPHAFLVTAQETHGILFVAPGGFHGAINKMNLPAQRMEVPRDEDIEETYANADLGETIKTFEQIGIRFLSPDEIRKWLPNTRFNRPVRAIRSLSWQQPLPRGSKLPGRPSTIRSGGFVTYVLGTWRYLSVRAGEGGIAAHDGDASKISGLNLIHSNRVHESCAPKSSHRAISESPTSRRAERTHCG